MTHKNNQKTSRFSNFGSLLTGRKIIPSPPSIVEKTHRHAAATIGFGAGENDWLGAEAYVDSLR